MGFDSANWTHYTLSELPSRDLGLEARLMLYAWDPYGLLLARLKEEKINI